MFFDKINDFIYNSGVLFFLLNMKKFFLFITLLLLAYLPAMNTTFASCPITYHDGEQEINKNKNNWLILTRENILDVCTNLHNKDDRRPDETFLKCSNRWITKIDSDVFLDLSGLKEIDLSCNYITWLKAWTFENLVELKKLDLWDNNINYLTKSTFIGLENITDLTLSNNQISKIQPWTFTKFKNLENLSLNNNQIANFSSWIFFGLNNLSLLSIYNNPAKSIEPWTFSDFKNLDSLSISLPSNMAAWIFAWLNNLKYLVIYLEDENLSNINIHEWFFSWLNNIQYLEIFGTWNAIIDFSKWNFSWLNSIENLYFYKIKIKKIDSWTFSKLTNLKNLIIRSVEEIEPWVFNNLNDLEVLYIWTSGDIKDWTFDWLNNLKLLSLYADWSIWKNVFSPIKDLKRLDLTVNNKNAISKGMFSNMKNLGDLSSISINSIDEEMKSVNHNAFREIIQIIQTCFYYDSLGILDLMPDRKLSFIYTHLKYSLIWITIFMFILIFANKYLKKKRWIWIIFSYFTMRKFSKYLSHTKKRWRHIMIKVILWLVFLAPLWLWLLSAISLITDDDFGVFYQVTGNLEDRYTEDIVSKETLVLEWETPLLGEDNKKFLRKGYDLYYAYRCSNSWDITKLKTLEKNTWKPYTLDKFYKEESYETILNNMKKNNGKCIEERKYWDILTYRSWDSWYTYVGKITPLSLLVTIGVRLLCIWIAFLIWWLLRYILMFLYYNIVLFFIKRTPWNNSNWDKTLNELSDIDVELLDDEIKKTQ